MLENGEYYSYKCYVYQLVDVKKFIRADSSLYSLLKGANEEDK